MSNFGKGFAQGFDLRPTTDLISRFLIGNAEHERQQKEKVDDEQRQLNLFEKKREQTNKEKLDLAQKQADAVKAILQGGTRTLDNSPLLPAQNRKPDVTSALIDPGQKNLIPTITNSLNPPTVSGETFKPHSQSKLVDLYQQAGMKPEEILKTINPKKEYSSYIEEPYRTLGRNKTTNQWEEISKYDQKNPAYKPDWKERELSTVYDPKTNKMKISHGNYDYKTNEFQIDDNKKPIVTKTTYEARSKEGTNGENQSSKEYTKRADGMFERMLGAKEKIASIEKMGFALNSKGERITDEKGKESLIKQYKDDENAVGEEYANFVKNTASDNFLDWYKSVWNTETKGKKKSQNPPTPEMFWDYAKEKYKKGIFDEQDLHSARLMFQATYHFDPIQRYGE